MKRSILLMCLFSLLTLTFTSLDAKTAQAKEVKPIRLELQNQGLNNHITVRMAIRGLTNGRNTIVKINDSTPEKWISLPTGTYQIHFIVKDQPANHKLYDKTRKFTHSGNGSTIRVHLDFWNNVSTSIGDL